MPRIPSRVVLSAWFPATTCTRRKAVHASLFIVLPQSCAGQQALGGKGHRGGARGEEEEEVEGGRWKAGDSLHQREDDTKDEEMRYHR